MSLRKLSSFFAAAALSIVSIVAVAAPANAAVLTATITPAGGASFVAGQLSPGFTATVPATGTAYNFDMVNVWISNASNQNWANAASCSSTPTALPACGVSSVAINGVTSSNFLVKRPGMGYLEFSPASGNNAVGTSETVTITFAPGTYTVGSAGAWTFKTSNLGGVNTATAAITVVAAPANQTVTFDANGGTGTMAAQAASSATNLTSNAFTRAGYTFAGWNTAADGTGTGYSDAASYGFGSSITLYAQWTAASSTDVNGSASNGLATTGAETGIPLAAAATLLLLGAALIVRRRNAA